MIGQIVITVFIVWFFIGLLLSIIGIVINDCTKLFTYLDTVGIWILVLWMVAVLITLYISLMRLIWV